MWRWRLTPRARQQGAGEGHHVHDSALSGVLVVQRDDLSVSHFFSSLIDSRGPNYESFAALARDLVWWADAESGSGQPVKHSTDRAASAHSSRTPSHRPTIPNACQSFAL